MLIKETIERPCCEQQDRRSYNGLLDPVVGRFNPEFCIHCGQIWIYDRRLDPAGSMDTVEVRVTLKTSAW